MFPADCRSGAETPGCHRCQHPWQWGWGPAIPSATASGQWWGGACVPGGFNCTGGVKAGRAANKKCVVLAVMGQDPRPFGRAQAKPSEAAFPLLLPEGGHTHAAKPATRKRHQTAAEEAQKGREPPCSPPPGSTCLAGGSLFPLLTQREEVLGERCDSKRDRTTFNMS